ncbi:CAF17-like 4Fe-4S cluster assembly/insertion protein YgfZ [Pseudobythopirellula maris]|uniref:CAF17-like 4Fe-4S cluster assembly/insertion protein YgfZ n=1 Tax=Pseudobythopirellula maris TaxID=2527991 RepID=UPI0018D28746|nr:folate-binding protein YgfZ [Pseudobythopirellula maris]
MATGPDAGRFLQSFCTNDVLRLAEGESCEAFFTDVKGRVLAYGWVGRTGEERYAVLLLSDGAADLSSHLDRYLIREKVELSTIHPTAGSACWASSREALLADDAGGFVLPTAALGEGSAALVHASASTPLSLQGEELDAAAFDALRIECGAPRDRQDFDERSLPQETQRDAVAISFTKGCYLGQEPVARIDALGQVNRLLVGVRFSGPAEPPVGSDLAAKGQTVGTLTSACYSEKLAAPIGLATVRRAQSAAGTELDCDGLRATVCPLPFV